MLLELLEVSKAYAAADRDSAGSPILRTVNLAVEKGQSLAITGPSGSGKTTLLNIIGTLDQPDRGQVLLQDRNLARLSEDQAARVRACDLGFVFQMHHLLPQLSVLENVLLPTLVGPPELRCTAKDRALSLLERVGLEPRRHHRPGQLSGGEKQRVAVVRALINQPQLLLADEPTGALDHAAATQLADLLVQLNQRDGVTLLVVTHWQALAQRMQRCLALQDGQLIETR